jgi:hypothetical protein
VSKEESGGTLEASETVTKGSSQRRYMGQSRFTPQAFSSVQFSNVTVLQIGFVFIFPAINRIELDSLNSKYCVLSPLDCYDFQIW